jgi:two-component sensor histidine kinase
MDNRALRMSVDDDAWRETLMLLHTRIADLECQLLKARQRFDIALRSSRVCVFVQDSELIYTDIINAPGEFDVSDMIGRHDDDVLEPSVAKMLTTAKTQVMEDGQLREVEITFDWERRKRHFSISIEPDYHSNGTIRGVVGVGVDITAEKEREEALRDALREMSHRTRNQLATLSSVVRHTSMSAASVKTFADKLHGRIAAMGLTQSLLVEDGWSGVSLKQLVQRHLLMCLSDTAPVSLSGPPVKLKPEPAQNLGLALHEFARNVQQHNNASRASGHVRAAWEADDTTGDVTLSLTERLADPEKRGSNFGFGTLMIRKVLPAALGEGASTDVRYSDAGAFVEVVIPSSCIAA